MLTFFKSLCIILWGFVVRLLKSMLEILVWIDQGVGLILAIPFYLFFGHPKPSADQTISGLVGYYAIRGYLWAKACEWVIDRLFYPFEGFKLGHCRKRLEWEEIDWDDVSNYQ